MGCEQSKSDVQEGCHKENAFRDEIIEMEDLEENRIQGMKWVPSDQKKNGEQSQ